MSSKTDPRAFCMECGSPPNQSCIPPCSHAAPMTAHSSEIRRLREKANSGPIGLQHIPSRDYYNLTQEGRTDFQIIACELSQEDAEFFQYASNYAVEALDAKDAEIADLRQQCAFNSKYTDTLQALGFDMRLLEEYNRLKMAERENGQEITRLRTALEEIRNMEHVEHSSISISGRMRRKAKAALEAHQ